MLQSDIDGCQRKILAQKFKAILNCFGPARRLVSTQRFVLSAVLVYQLALPHRFEDGDDLLVGRKPYLQAA
jgi:hypothetical protein